ncbi:hypothetical protein F511_35138 [Dorcoceras hygrometricum]|uniref:Uncharacterized protein n=1 Tax=Dorcoceras hygrometricum TaxID=472368 RepID=A0A2Z7CIE2_9LAMI|nr:hypothetical protein F511_35138 [Dorcoceras hygrometricum]
MQMLCMRHRTNAEGYNRKGSQGTSMHSSTGSTTDRWPLSQPPPIRNYNHLHDEGEGRSADQIRRFSNCATKSIGEDIEAIERMENGVGSSSNLAFLGSCKCNGQLFVISIFSGSPQHKMYVTLDDDDDVLNMIHLHMCMKLSMIELRAEKKDQIGGVLNLARKATEREGQLGSADLPAKRHTRSSGCNGAKLTF